MEFKHATLAHEPIVSNWSGHTAWPLRFDTCPIHRRICGGYAVNGRHSRVGGGEVEL